MDMRERESVCVVVCLDFISLLVCRCLSNELCMLNVRHSLILKLDNHYVDGWNEIHIFAVDDSEANSRSSKYKHKYTDAHTQIHRHTENGKAVDKERVYLFSKGPLPQSIIIIEFNEFVKFYSMKMLSVGFR